MLNDKTELLKLFNALSNEGILQNIQDEELFFSLLLKGLS